jgi:metal-dependent HD superfamily phosphatase/phosphodiesterase
MTDNKRTTNKQIFEKLENLKMTDTELNALAIKIVSRMVKLKSMEDWFHHVSQSDIAWSVAYQDLELDEEVEALGEAAKLMTIMEICKEDEQYEKCAIIKNRMEEINKILRKGKKR